MKYEPYFKFEDLKIYQKALVFGELVNEQICKFPRSETFKLSSQFIRAADSIALNITEGYSGSSANFTRYLGIARGSLDECVVCSTKACRRGFITKEVNMRNRKKLAELSKMISSYMNYLNKNSYTKSLIYLSNHQTTKLIS